MLSAALTTGTQAAGAQMEGEAQARATQAQGLQTQLQMLRQEKEDQIAEALKAAQTAHFNASTNAINNPPPKDAEYELKTDAEGNTYRIDKRANMAEPTQLKPPPSAAPIDAPAVSDAAADPQGSPTAAAKPALPSLKLKVAPKAPIPGTPAYEAALANKPMTPYERAQLAQGAADKTLVSVVSQTDPTKNELVPRSQAAGRTPAKTGTSAGAGGALANRQKDYVSLMTNALPELERLSTKVTPTNITLAIKSPAATNYIMSPEDRQYMIKARDFLAGVLHEESGARLSDAQVAWGVPRYIIQGGDDPATIQAKLKNARDVATSRAANIAFVPPGAPISDKARQELEGLGGGGRGGDGGGKIDPAHFAQLSKDDQEYFRAQGRAP